MKHVPLLVALVAACALPTSAHAGVAPVTAAVSHGTANCQTALPVFDTHVRKRPMAIANEGDTTVFMTCDSENVGGGGGVAGVSIGLVNRAGAPDVTVSCTLVDGMVYGAAYITKSLTIAASGTNLLMWEGAEDTPFGIFVAPAVSCALPPGVDIGLVEYRLSPV
jgi:hypothetical protein